jgi:hypothetical protein
MKKSTRIVVSLCATVALMAPAAIVPAASSGKHISHGHGGNGKHKHHRHGGYQK